MSRTKTVVAHHSQSSPASSFSPKQTTSGKNSSTASLAVAWLGRAALIACIGALAAAWQPFGLSREFAIGAGLVFGAVLVAVEMLFRRAQPSGLMGAAAGILFGLVAALLTTLVISRTAEPEQTKTFLEYGSLVGFGYLGIFLGASKGHLLLPKESVLAESASGGPLDGESSIVKLLDTSVLIDGRIADICEAQFLDGPLQVPQFVLHELQQIADSADTLRRQRGRRGLEVLQRIQKMPQLEVSVVDDAGISEGEVDHKLVEFAKRTGAKIVTNDFNLNKVASVQGIAVLNVNQLANALRPAVLPGEPMRVFILREGKEQNQGVAYLEDGTMVVVDGARRLMNKNVDIIVTSVHQTPAGKMIFGRLEDRSDSAPIAKHAAAGRGENGGRSSE